MKKYTIFGILAIAFIGTVIILVGATTGQKPGGGYIGIVTVSGVVSALLWPVLVSVFRSLVDFFSTGFSLASLVGLVGFASLVGLVGLFGLVGLAGTSFNLVNYNRIYKIFKKNNKGYTLIEILIALGILSITSGIAYVSYRGYNVNVTKKDLKLHGELFASNVQNCITVRRGWKIDRLDRDGNIISNNDTPCRPDGTAQEDIKNSLKKKLDFICPADSVCNIWTRDGNEPKLRYTCLSIEKEVSGKKLQVISRVSWETPSQYEIWCNEVDAYLKFEFGGMRCRRGADKFMHHPPGDNSNPTSNLMKDCPDW